MTNQPDFRDPRYAHLPPPPGIPAGPAPTPASAPWWSTPPDAWGRPVDRGADPSWRPSPPGAADSGPERPPVAPVDAAATRRRIELDVRNIVLGLGVTCLITAALSFLAVNWESFDAAMRAGLLVGATVTTALAGVALRRRGYSGTAAALSWLTMVLAFVDLFAVERALDPALSADGFAAIGGIVLFAGFVAADTWRRDLAMQTGAVAAWLLASMSALVAWEVTGLDLWILPWAAVVAWLQWRSTLDKPGAGSWERYGVALALVALPAVLTALDDPNLARPVIVIAVATIVLVAGVQFRHLAALWIGGTSLGVLVAAYLVDALRGVPGWAVFALVGVILLGVGACIEHRLRRTAGSDGGAAGDAVTSGRRVGHATPTPAWR